MTTEAFVCKEVAGPHHYHTDKQLYVGSAYMAVCCHCGRVQFIVYRGREETPDLHWMGGSGCGAFYR